MTFSRIALALAVALLVVTAGCSGIGDGGTDGPDVDTAAAGSSDDDASDDGSTDRGTDTATPIDAGDDGDGDGDAMSSDHTRSLRDAGSFTSVLSVNLTVVRNGEPVPFIVSDSTYRIDFDADRFHERTEAVSPFGNTSIERYTTGDTTYVKRTRGNATQYGTATEPYGDDVAPVNVTEASGASTADVAADEPVRQHLTNEGTETFRGVTVTRWEATGVEVLDDVEPDIAGDFENVTGFELVLLVDDDGITRYVRFSIEFEETNDGDSRSGTLVVEQTVSDVGSTSVAEPGWLEAAENASAERLVGAGSVVDR